VVRESSITLNRLKGVLAQNAARFSASMLAGLSGIPQPTLAAALRNPNVYLGAQREADLLSLATRCVEMLDAILPLRLAAGDWTTLKQLLQSGRGPEAIRATVLSLLEPVNANE
jgi:hypothetical protein